MPQEIKIDGIGISPDVLTAIVSRAVSDVEGIASVGVKDLATNLVSMMLSSKAPASEPAVEAEVNAFIRQNAPVETRIMTPDDARGLGAQALFGEKYGDEVRVVSMGELSGSGKGANGQTYSLELCGGTHVARTGDIGMFALTAETASVSFVTNSSKYG